jgi:hypothetical protein
VTEGMLRWDVDAQEWVLDSAWRHGVSPIGRPPGWSKTRTCWLDSLDVLEACEGDAELVSLVEPWVAYQREKYHSRTKGMEPSRKKFRRLVHHARNVIAAVKQRQAADAKRAAKRQEHEARIAERSVRDVVFEAFSPRWWEHGQYE